MMIISRLCLYNECVILRSYISPPPAEGLQEDSRRVKPPLLSFAYTEQNRAYKLVRPFYIENDVSGVADLAFR